MFGRIGRLGKDVFDPASPWDITEPFETPDITEPTIDTELFTVPEDEPLDTIVKRGNAAFSFVRLRITAEGVPVKDALVTITPNNPAVPPVAARSNDEGLVNIKIATPPKSKAQIAVFKSGLPQFFSQGATYAQDDPVQDLSLTDNGIPTAVLVGGAALVGIGIFLLLNK